MINIYKYVKEALHINKNTVIKDLHDVRMPPLPWPEHQDIVKMKDYHNKGSKPERLVASIKDRSKLIRRWRVAINMKWDAAIPVFSKAMVDRGILTQEQVDKYLEDNYK